MNPNARVVFSNLSRISFNHSDRKDPQQIFMEPLEIVAVEEGLKPAFATGQSSYNRAFNRCLERFGKENGFNILRTKATSVHTQLRALPTHKIPVSLLMKISQRISQSQDNAADQVIWLYKDAGIGAKILGCVEGINRMGDVFGYPTCCTDNYLNLEARIVENDLDYFRTHCAAKLDSDFLNLYDAEVKLSGDHAREESRLFSEIKTLQASSIKRFPFVHFIACPHCIDSDSPAAQLNQKMEALASRLSKTFSRKFTDYATRYTRIFEQHHVRRKFVDSAP